MVPPPPALAITMGSQIAQDALDAYRRCLMGLTHRGLRELEALRSAPAARAERGEVHVLAALGARVFGSPEAALVRLAAASVDLDGSNEALRTLVELLSLETNVSLGKLESAKTRLVEIAASLPASLVDALNGLLRCARGEMTEGLALLEGAVPKLTGLTARWASVLYAENLIDAVRHEAALSELTKLTTGVEFDEVTMRAWASISLVHALRSESPRFKEALRAARLVTQNVPRYRAMADVAEGVGRTRLDDGADVGMAAAERGLKVLGGSAYRYDEARALVHAAEAVQSRTQQRVLPWSSRGRDLLSRMGLVARLERMTRNQGGGGESGSLMLSTAKSLQRSMVGVGAGDDVELGAIFEINRHVGSALRIEEVLQRLLESVITVLKGERGAILRGTGDQAKCIAAKGIDPAQIKPNGNEVSFSVIHEAEKQGEPVLADNAQLDSRFKGQASVMASDVRSVICAPLKTAKGTWGTLYIDTRVGSRVFRDHHRDLLGVFCTQAATALENASMFEQLDELNRTLESKVDARTAELEQSNRQLEASLHELKTTQLALVQSQRDALDQEMKVARDIQVALVPSREPIVLPGLKVAGVLEPASYCGGDLWCALPLSGNRTLIFLGDVTGHGVGSALIASAAKAVIDTSVRLNPNLELPQLMSAVSDAIFDSRKANLAMTGVSLLFDPATKKLTFCIAAHPSPMMLSGAAGLPQISMLSNPGSRMGEKHGLTFETSHRDLAGGERVVIFTDGLSEGVNPKGKPWGLKAFSNAIVSHATSDVAALRDQVLADAKTFFAGVMPEDDVTLVVLEVDS